MTTILHRPISCPSSAKSCWRLARSGFALAMLAALVASAQRSSWAQPNEADTEHSAARLASTVDNAEEAVRSGRAGLRPWFGFPWYDSNRDELKPVYPESAKASNSSIGLPFTASFLNFIAWGLIALFLAGLVALVIHFYLKREFKRSIDAVAQARGEVHPDRVEALPSVARRVADDLLGAARRHYEAGNFSEAIIYLYSHELLELDKHQWIELARGRTNRQYLGQVSRQPQLALILGQTMLAFEDVYFGNHPLSRARFEASWQRLNEFETLVEQVAA